jgi:hypothetical protein
MLSQRGARGVQNAELSGDTDSENNNGGSSTTYVLHRAGCTQEDDQLLRKGRKRSGSPARQSGSDRWELDDWVKALPQPRTVAMEGQFSPVGSTIT